MFDLLFILCLYYNVIFCKNQPSKITQKQYYFLLNILSRYVLFDGLFYDSFCFIAYCVTLSSMKLFVNCLLRYPFPFYTFEYYSVTLSPMTRGGPAQTT